MASLHLGLWSGIFNPIWDINLGLNGGMWDVTTSQAALNAVVAFEVFCWFCVGEIIGKGSIVGYNVWIRLGVVFKYLV